MEAIRGYLTYVEDCDNLIKLYLTEEKFEEDGNGHYTVWGDDWNDQPYEHNAGEPYNEHTVIIIDNHDRNSITPNTGHTNSPHSVLGINVHKYPWILSSDGKYRLLPNATFEDVVEYAKNIEVDIYIRYGSMYLNSKSDFHNEVNEYTDYI